MISAGLVPRHEDSTLLCGDRPSHACPDYPSSLSAMPQPLRPLVSLAACNPAHRLAKQRRRWVTSLVSAVVADDDEHTPVSCLYPIFDELLDPRIHLLPHYDANCGSVGPAGQSWLTLSFCSATVMR